MRNGDIVPLTEVFETIANNQYLITDRFEKILRREAELGIEFANAKDAEVLDKLGSEYIELQRSFNTAMKEVFGLEKITWETSAK